MSGRLGRRTILIADDEPELRQILAFELEFHGAVCLHASDGDEAWKLLQANSIDVVISDMKMPRGGGVDLLRQIRERLGGRIVVMLVSGFVEHAEQDLLSAGADAIYSKPFDTEKMINDLVRIMADRACR